MALWCRGGICGVKRQRKDWVVMSFFGRDYVHLCRLLGEVASSAPTHARSCCNCRAVWFFFGLSTTRRARLRYIVGSDLGERSIAIVVHALHMAEQVD